MNNNSGKVKTKPARGDAKARKIRLIKLTDQNITTFERLGRQDASFRGLRAQLQELCIQFAMISAADNEEPCRIGLSRAIDLQIARFAMRPAETEADLALKLAAVHLVVASRDEHKNLCAMVYAALVADVARIFPGKTAVQIDAWLTDEQGKMTLH